MNEPRKSRRLNTSGANHARQEAGTGFDTPVQQHRPVLVGVLPDAAAARARPLLRKRGLRPLPAVRLEVRRDRVRGRLPVRRRCGRPELKEKEPP